MIHIDLVVCGSVAVNLTGVRLGKGGGYFDREIALLRRGGLIDLTTVIATTVHPFQVRPDPLPTEAHDVNVDIIVSSDGTGNI
jgi:5-formyltetrahydrofolate cyclo-ligase